MSVADEHNANIEEQMAKSPYGQVADLPRPTWDETYMTVACVYSRRSPDPNTKHGCVIISADNRIVGCGYNGFPKGGKDDSIYPITRPRKYRFIPHSELNALLNRTLNTEGGTVYVTGRPCSGCMIAMIQGGIKRIVYGEIGSHCVDQEDWAATNLMAENCGINLVQYQATNSPQQVLADTQRYLELKSWK